MLKTNQDNSVQNPVKELTLIRLNELCKLTTLKPSTVFKCIKNGSIPRPWKLLGKINVWDKQEILTWLDSKKQ